MPPNPVKNQTYFTVSFALQIVTAALVAVAGWTLTNAYAQIQEKLSDLNLRAISTKEQVLHLNWQVQEIREQHSPPLISPGESLKPQPKRPTAWILKNTQILQDQKQSGLVSAQSQPPEQPTPIVK